MKFFAVTWIFLLQLFTICVAEVPFPVEDGVLVLGEDNFDEAIETHSHILVEFYAPWCGHCKQLAPEYAKAAKALADSPVKLAKVDATEHNKLGKRYDVKGFPTLKFFKNGKPTDYGGGRTESEIVQWLSKKIGPPATEVKTEEALEKLQETHDVFVLGVFSSLTSEAAKRFLSIASKEDGYTFAITAEESLKSKLAVTEDTIIIHKTFDELRNDIVFTDALHDDEILTFIKGNAQPLIQEFSQQSSQKIFSSKVTKHVLFFTNKRAPHHQSVIASFRSVASQFKGQLLFVNVPSTEKKVLEFFDITEDTVPATILADLGSESGIKKYRYTGDHSEESLKAFLVDYFEDKLKPFLKSEEPEETDTTGDVVVLRGTTFQDLVINNTKDVLVKFYAPWCGHCKSLAPTWEELGKQVKSISNQVVIAKIDSTANEIDVPGVVVKGFPTLYFFKGDDKEHPVKYSEGRELDDFLDFLQKNSHNSFSHDEL